MFEEILGKHDVIKHSFLKELKKKLDDYYWNEIVRVVRIKYRDGMFFFGTIYQTDGEPFKEFTIRELADIFSSTGKSKILLTDLEYDGNLNVGVTW
jgi:hypothetical protein